MCSGGYKHSWIKYSWNKEDSRYNLEFDWYSQETLQNKNIHEYKLQMIYSRNYTGTPTHLLAQFL